MTDDGMWVIGYGSLIFKPLPYYSFKVNGYIKGFVRRFWQSSSDHRGTPESPGRVVTLILLLDLKQHARFHDNLHMYELNHHHRESDLQSDSDGASKSQVHDVVQKIHQLSNEDLKVWGCAYYVAKQDVEKVKQYLDIREQDGYTTHRVPFHIMSGPTKFPECPECPEMNQIFTQLPQNENGDYIIESLIYIGTIDNESFIGPEDIEQTGKIIRESKGPSGENSEYLLELCKAVRHLDAGGKSRDFYLEDLAAIVQGGSSS